VPTAAATGEMNGAPESLTELRRARSADAGWLVDLVLPDIGGGRFASADFARVEQRPDASALRVSGLDQPTFEELISQHGGQFAAIQFWKCPRLTDLTPLESLPDLRLVSFYWNQRASRLWDLTKTPALVGLHFDDFTRLRDLSDLAVGSSLIELEFGDAVWNKSVFESLDPLAELQSLRDLKLSAKRINDGRIEPLGALQALSALSFSSKQFTTAQVAWLRARLPDSLQCEALEPLRHLSPPLRVGGKVLDVLLVGKRKPFLNSADDAARIQKHVGQFGKMVAEFRANPSLLAD
jgi:hypothetical protein